METLLKSFLILVLLSGLMSCAAPSFTRPAELHETAFQAYRAGDLVNAEGLLREALKMAPERADSWFLLGNIFLRTRQYEAAQNAYQHAANLKPQQVEIWHNLAVTHLRQATQTLLEGRRHVEDDFNPLLEWLLQVQGAAAGS